MFRHNSILKHIVDTLQENIDHSQIDARVYADLQGYTTNGGTIPVQTIPTAQKPDLVIFLPRENTIHIQELTVPFEQNIKASHERKVNKYTPLVSDLRNAGISVTLTCFEVGSRGLITPDNKDRIRTLFRSVKAKAPKKLFRDISRMSLLSSYAIWRARHEPHWEYCAIE